MPRTKVVALLLVGLTLTCAAAAAPLQRPRRPAGLLMTLEIARAAFAADTLIAAATWSAYNDGRGPLDSLTANVVNLSAPGGMLHKKLPGTATAVEFRQMIPPVGSEYQIVLQVCTWRGRAPTQCVQAEKVFLYEVLDVLPVADLTVTVRKAP